MLPTLRLGFLVTPPSLRAALHKAKFLSDWHSSALAQAALARFLDEGAFARHVRRRTQSIENGTGSSRMPSPVISPTHLELDPIDDRAPPHRVGPEHVDGSDRRGRRRAAEGGVAVQILSRFAASESPRAGIMLGYGAIPTARIEEGMQLLRACFERDAQ